MYPNTVLINGWTQTNSSTYEWYAQVGATASINTGPATDHSGTGTQAYMYTEASMGNVNDLATLISPEIAVDVNGHSELSFWYHMFGSAMGTLTVYVYDVNDSANNNLSATSISGQQHFSDSAAWSQSTSSLIQFAGDTIKVEFRATRGSAFQSDLAIDDVEVYRVCPLVVTDTVADDVCGAGGYAGVNISNSHGVVNYTWSNGANTPSISGLTAGTYSYTVVDDSCTRIGSIVVNAVSTVTAFPWIQQYSQCGQANGSAFVNATSNFPPLTYLWSNGSTSITATGLAAGVHTVTVTDNSGCSIVKSVTMQDINTLVGI